MNDTQKSAYWALGLPVLLIGAAYLIPLPNGLTQAGAVSIAILFSSVVLWLLQPLPWAITTILMTSLMPFFDVLSVPDVFSKLGSSIFFFMVATFCITIALSSTSIPTRLAAFILRTTKCRPVPLIFGFMAGTALLSSVMSNVPTCVVFSSLAMAIFTREKGVAPACGLEKSLLIGIPFASVIGGFMTPAGTSNNILALSLYETLTGKTITFLQWMMVGVPTAVLSLIVCGLWLVIVFKPQAAPAENTQKIQCSAQKLGPMTSREIKVLLILLLMFTLWIAGSWIKPLDTTIVALLCMCLFFFPGIEVLRWEDYARNAPFDLIFMISGVGVLAHGLTATGASDWFVLQLLAEAGSWSPFIIILASSALVAVLHILIPAGAGAVAVAMSPLIMLSNAAGIDAFSIAMLCAFWGAVVFVLPVDAVAIVTYSTGRYTAVDLLKAGAVPTVVLVVLTAMVVPYFCSFWI